MMESTGRPLGRFFCFCVLFALLASVGLPVAVWAAPQKTNVVDILYRADGTPAHGTVTIRWDAFTASDGSAVAAGLLALKLGSDGTFSAQLVPNTGAKPEGSYYRVVMKLDDGTTSEEAWAVPTVATTTIAAIRATVTPASVAAQYVGRDYVDSAIAAAMAKASGGYPGVTSDGGNGIAVQGGVAASATLTKMLNKEFMCGGYSASGQNTALDNCWADVVAYYNANASPTTSVVADVHLPAGVLPTKYGLQIPVPSGANLPLTPRIFAEGKGEFGVGTTIQLTSAISTAVISEPWLPKSLNGGYWSNTVMRGFTVDANNLAPSCLDVYGQRFGVFEHISCMNAAGGDHWMAIGDVDQAYGGQVPSGYQGIGLNTFVDDVFVYANYTASYATVAVSLNGDALSFVVTNGGSYRNAGPLYVNVVGFGNGAMSVPCTTMPSGLQANMTYNSGTGFYQVSSITAASYGSGCSGTVYASIPGLPVSGARYGVILAN
ncbi:MAG TPA: hypothetical protein VMU24_03805, partial [Candidatus Acidoferrales bacterium]|nr:hypothetical protein [Candidatus Acidoferrales bacterium]